MNSRNILAWGAGALLAMGALSATAQVSRPLNVLETNPDARTSALADVMSTRADRMSLFVSPAALLGSDKTFGAEVSSQIYPKIEGLKGQTFQINAVAGYRFLDRHAVTIGYRYQGMPEAVYFDMSNPAAQMQTVRPFDWALDLGYGIRLGKGFSLSASGNVIASWIGKGAYTFSGSIGAFYQTKISHPDTEPFDFSAGLKINDLGQPINYKGPANSYAVPASLQLGTELGFSLGGKNHMDVLAGGRYFFLPKDATLLLLGVGAEYDYDDLLFARAGYQYGQKGLSFATLGAGAKVLGGLTFDFSYRFSTSKVTGANIWSVGVGYEF